jgi:NADPH:quinone reductase-like Zn-dependent oxidoreductase
VQLGKALGHRVIGTSRTEEKLERCLEFGLDSGIVVGSEPKFSEDVLTSTNGSGVDVILDLVGGAYFEQNLKSLALKGRLLLVGMTSGSRAEFNLGIALSRTFEVDRHGTSSPLGRRQGQRDSRIRDKRGSASRGRKREAKYR